MIEQFREQGITILVEPIVKPWGQTIAYIADQMGIISKFAVH